MSEQQEQSMDPWSMFLYGMKAPMTREKYKGRLAKFFDFIGLQGLIEERARAFADRSRKDPDWLFTSLLRFAQAQKERVERGEMSSATLRNYFKAARLFCEMNDIAITWKKITRGLPKARRFADDRAPTLDEIRKIIEYPDRRIKPVVYAMSSSGMRLETWNYLRWGIIGLIVVIAISIVLSLYFSPGGRGAFFPFSFGWLGGIFLKFIFF
jgi:hypothetical protein